MHIPGLWTRLAEMTSTGLRSSIQCVVTRPLGARLNHAPKVASNLMLASLIERGTVVLHR